MLEPTENEIRTQKEALEVCFRELPTGVIFQEGFTRKGSKSLAHRTAGVKAVLSCYPHSHLGHREVLSVHSVVKSISSLMGLPGIGFSVMGADGSQSLGA